MVDLSDKAIWYEHMADKSTSRTHVHGFLLNSSIKTDSCKNWIKKELGVETFEKTDWVFATSYTDRNKKKIPITLENYGKYITYMTKGRLDPVCIKGFEPEIIRDFKGAWVAPCAITVNPNYQHIAYKLVKPETPKEKKLRESELMDLIVKRYNEKYNEACWDTQAAINHVVDVLKEQKHLLGVPKVRDWVWRFKMGYHTQNFKDEVLQSMLR